MAQIAIQSCHACIEAANEFKMDQLKEHPHLVLCGIKSEHKLHNVQRHLDALNVRYKSFVEPDIGDQLTAICTESVPQSMRQHFRKYQCLRRAA